MQDDDKTAYEVTVAIDNGELPSGNGRKTSCETAETVVGDAMDYPRHSYEVCGAELLSAPSFADGDTTWVVQVTLAVSPDAAPPDEGPHIEAVEQTGVVFTD